MSRAFNVMWFLILPVVAGIFLIALAGPRIVAWYRASQAIHDREPDLKSILKKKN